MAHMRRIAAGVLALAAIAAVVAGCGGDGDGGVTANRPGTGTGAAVTDTRTYRDPEGDVAAGLPDLTAVTIASDATTVSMRFTFRSAPPLRTDAAAGWTDMLLVGIDVPPIGPGPQAGGGDWVGVDYAFGVHAIERQARLRSMGAGLGGAAPGPPTTLPTRWSGRSISIDLKRSLIGDPPYFDFVAAVGREGSDESGEGDALPATGTLRYTLARSAG